jgi:hypothetical protein
MPIGRVSRHLLYPAPYVQRQVAQAAAREKFLEALDEVSGGKLRQGLQALLPVARDYKAAGWTLDWWHLEAAVDPQGKALARQLRELFESLGLTRERLPDPWPFEVACRTLRQALEFPDPAGNIAFDATPAFWENFDPKPIHALLQGIVYHPMLTPRITVHEGFEVKVRTATQQEEQERLVKQVLEARAYLEALARLLEVMEQHRSAEWLVAGSLRLRGRLPSLPAVRDALAAIPEDRGQLEAWVEDYIRGQLARAEKETKAKPSAVIRTPHVAPEAFRCLAASLLGQSRTPYAGGKDPAYVRREIKTLARLLPLKLESRRGRPRKRPEAASAVS